MGKSSGENKRDCRGVCESNGKNNYMCKSDTSLKGYVIALADDSFNIMDNRFWTVPTYALVHRVFKDFRIDGGKGADFFNESIKGFCPDRKPIDGTNDFTRGCSDKSGKMYSCSFHIARNDMRKLMDAGAEYLRGNPGWKGYGHKWLKATDIDPKWTKNADYKSLYESDYDVALDIFSEWAMLLGKQSRLDTVVFINITNHPQMVFTKSN